jgi:flavodoxin
MKSAVVYCTATGSTKKIAEAIQGELGADTPLATMDGHPDLGGRDVVFVGFPINVFGPPQVAKDYLATDAAGKCIALFITHASPDDQPTVQDWLKTCKEAAAAADIVGIFHCQGQLAEPVKQHMLNSGDPQKVAWAQADDSQGRPDEAAIERARAFARTVVSPTQV